MASRLSPYLSGNPSSFNPLPANHAPGLGDWIRSALFSPARWTAAEATEGLSRQLFQFGQTHQSGLADLVQGVFNDALLKKAPDTLYELRNGIREFQKTPSTECAEKIRSALETFTSDHIPFMEHKLSPEGSARMRQLSLTIGVVQSAADPFPVPETVHKHMGDVEAIASYLIMSSEGTLQSAMEFLRSVFFDDTSGFIAQAVEKITASLSAPDGPIEHFRHSLIIDDASVLNQATHLLRDELCSKPHRRLQDCQHALVNLDRGLETNLSREALLPLWQRSSDTLFHLEQRKAEIFKRHPISPDEWVKVNSFRLQLQTWISTADYFPTHAEQQQAAAFTFDLIESAYNGQKGIMEAAGDILLEKVNTAVRSIEMLPGKMAAKLFQAAPAINNLASAVAAFPLDPPLSEDAPGGSFIETFISYAGPIVSRIVDDVTSALSQRAATFLSTSMLFIFDKIRSNLQQDASHPHVDHVIDPLIEKILAARQSGSWKELANILQECFQVLRQQQIYFQGARFPLNPGRTYSTSVIPEFLGNIANHEAALNAGRQRGPQQITRAMIEWEAYKLQTQSAAFFPMKFISEYVCGLEGGDSLYAALLEIPPMSSIELSADTFRDRFFATIEQADISILRKWAGKALYYLTLPFSTFFVKGFFNNMFSHFQRWQNTDDPANPRDVEVIELAQNWLAILSGSYNQAAESPALQARKLMGMLGEALHAPQRNHGLTQSEIYSTFAQTALEVLGPRFNWRQKIGEYFNWQFEETSPFQFFNPILKGFNIVASPILNAMILVPEWMANQILQNGGKLFLRNNDFLQNKIETTFNALSYNTPVAHALNKVIFRQLQKIRDAIQIGLAQDTPLENGLPTRHSQKKKWEISILVEYLFEVLNKSEYNTQDNLRKYLEGRLTLTDRVAKEIDAPVMPKVLETIVDAVAIALDTSMSKEGLDEWFYDILVVANGTFEPQLPVSEEEFAVLEKGIAELSDQILESSIFYALSDIFDFHGENQKQGVRHFFAEMKEDTQHFIETTRSSLEANAYDLISRVDFMQILRNRIECSKQYQSKHVEALSRADGNRHFQTETKQKINKISSELVVHCRTIGKMLDDSARLQEEVERKCTDNNLMERCLRSVLAFERLLAHPGIQNNDLNEAEVQMVMLLRTTLELRRGRYSESFLRTLNNLQAQAAPAKRQVETSLKDLHLMIRVSSLFHRLREEKLRAWPNSSSELKKAEWDLIQALNTLSNRKERDMIVSHVLAVMSAPTQMQLTTEIENFRQSYSLIFSRSTETLNAAQAHIRNMAQAFNEVVSSEKNASCQVIQESRNSMAEKVEQIRHQLDELEQWNNRPHGIPISNFVLFDMQWLTDMTKNLAFERAHAKVQQLLKALYQKHNYASALHHLILFPFLEKHGKHHLTSSL